MFAFSPNWIMRNAPSPEPFGLFALFCALTALPAALMIRVLEPELVLPAFSILLFVEAAVAPTLARFICGRERGAGVTMWDFVGAFTLIGCAATLLSGPEHDARV